MDEPTVPAPTLTLAAYLDKALAQVPDEPPAAYQLFERVIQEVQQFQSAPEFQAVQQRLHGMLWYYAGLATAQIDADFTRAAELFQASAKALSSFNDHDLSRTADALGSLYQGLDQLRRQNFQAGLELIRGAEARLASVPNISPSDRLLVGSVACESLIAAGAIALQKQDLTLARTLIEGAAAKADNLAKLFEPGSASNYYYLGLAKLYRAQYRLAWQVSTFAGVDLPAVAGDAESTRLADEAVELLGKFDELTRNVNRPEVAAGLHQQSIAIMSLLKFLPAAATLVDTLVWSRPSTKVDYTVLRQLLDQAEAAAASGGEAQVLLLRQCQKYREMLENLRRIEAQRPQPIGRPDDPTSPIRLFVIMPYSAESSKAVEAALRKALEDDPYWFQLVLAKDVIIESRLFENIRSNMSESDAFLADITGLNPNVMLELGMVMNDPAKRPIFLLRQNTKDELPSDIKGILYIDYNLPGGIAFDEQVRILAEDLKANFGKRKEFLALRDRAHRRFAGSTYIERMLGRLRLSEKELASLQSAFPSVEELQGASADQIGRKTGLDANLSRDLAGIFGIPAPTALAAK